jgi:hypothetical protein
MLKNSEGLGERSDRRLRRAEPKHRRSKDAARESKEEKEQRREDVATTERRTCMCPNLENI